MVADENGVAANEVVHLRTGFLADVDGGYEFGARAGFLRRTQEISSLKVIRWKIGR
jgi:hypothetical protein